MTKYALRTRFAKDMVTECFPPARKTKRERVVIICEGMPTMPGKGKLLEFLSKKGFWAFEPRYRGSWESGGMFLKKSPEQDILDVINGLSKGFTSIFDGKKYRVDPDEIFIIGNSFGGPAAILASRDPRVKKVVGISPVVDWQAPSDAEPLDTRGAKLIRDAFGNGYRFRTSDWTKLARGTFYNPANHSKEIDGSKLLLFHAKDDESVRWQEVVQFARLINATLKFSQRGGHLSATRTVEKHWKQIAKFFAKK